MKKTLALLTAPLILLAASAATAENRFGLAPYVGVDAEFRHMDYHKDFGGNIINHDAPQGNVYAGVRLSEYFAVEAGYEATKTKTKRSTLNSNDVLGGFPLAALAGDTIQLSTTNQTKGLHANLVGFLPICDLYRLQLIGMVGFARLKTKSTQRLLVDTTGAAFPQDQDSINIFTAKKSVLRLGAGLQHLINCNWGVRGMVKWEQSKKLKMSSTNPVLNGGDPVTLLIRAKNSVIYSIGAFYMF